MADTDTTGAFEHGEGYAQGELAGGLGLGPLEQQYEELFAEALADGVITAEERARLERAADNLGVDRSRLFKLEQAMVAAYESHHRVRIVEHYEEAPQSLAPIQVEAEGDAARTVLLKRVEQLEARVRELEEELRVAQSQINVEVDLSSLDAAADESVEAAEQDTEALWRRVRRNPTEPSNYHELHRAFKARGEADKQWCVAQALTALGENQHRAEFLEHRSQTLITPKVSLTQNSWYDHLYHPEQEVLTGQIFSVIAPAVLLGRVTGLRRDKALFRPDPETKQDPTSTTITAVRALHWASALLGLATPPIYLAKDRESGYEHIPGVPPVSLVGRGVLSGRTQLEHAFLAGQHLAFYRQEHFVKTLYSAVPDLEDLFLAALIIGDPKLPIASDTRRRVEPIARAIEPVLEPAHVDALRGHFLRFVEDGGRTNLQRWSAATDMTACRAGMLICNDLATALDLLKERGGELSDQAKDLLAFTVSEPYFRLRRQLGIAVG